MVRADITVGDQIAFEGGRRVSSVGGEVIKAGRVNLVLRSLYMGRFMQELKIPRAKLEGKGRVLRAGVLYTVESE